jgi:hypothetical protein
MDAVSLLCDFQALNWPPKIYNQEEKQAAELADLIIAHSNQTKQFYQSFFSHVEGKIHNRVFQLNHLFMQHVRKYQAKSKPFFERSNDVLFVSNNWRLTEKNYSYVATIAANLPDTNIHIVGEIPHPIPGVTNHNNISDFKSFYELMGDSKSLVDPSRLDSPREILPEGAAMGCNIVASRNCGQWRLCNPNLLVEDFTPQGFIDKIRLSLNRKLPDNSTDFESSSDIVDILELLKLVKSIK